MRRQRILLKFPEGLLCRRLPTLPLWGCLFLSSVFYVQHKMKWNYRAPQAMCVNSVYHWRGKGGCKEHSFLKTTPPSCIHREAFAGKGGARGSLTLRILILYSLSIFFKHGLFYDLPSGHWHKKKIFAKWKEKEQKYIFKSSIAVPALTHKPPEKCDYSA